MSTNNNQTIKIGTVLETLGIAGWSAMEARILSAMKAGIPLLFIGDRGTSKTEACFRLSRALQGKVCNFQKYDTPDLSLDDVIGFRNLKDMESGKLSYIATGTAIWDKTAVLWDEINRANPMFQSKLLEVVRTGNIHGMRTTVKFQFATANPPRALGNSVAHETWFMPDALAARFHHVMVPNSSASLFDAALKHQDARMAFDNNDTEKIGSIIAPIGQLWIEYAGKNPSNAMRESAQTVVRYVMQTLDRESSVHNFFDIRAALRTVEHLAQLLLLDSFTPIQNIQGVIKEVVVGNIAELSGMTRTDYRQFQPNIEGAVAQAVAEIMRSRTTTANPTNGMPIISHAFNLLREAKLDEVSIQNLLARIESEADAKQALSGLTRGIGANQDKYRSPQFRNAHRRALTLLAANNPTLMISNDTAELFAARHHNKWYADNKL